GEKAFYGCSSLKEVTIPESVTSIKSYTFSGCSSLTQVTIPESVTSIENYAFSSCSSLKEITIPESVTSIGNYAFENCTGLVKATINGSTTGDYTFSGCNTLKSVTMGNSVKNIGNSTFDSCEGLESVVIGSSVKEIGDYAFWFCTCLSDVTSLNPEPPTCASNSFSYVDTSTCTLTVPAGSMQAYASASVWKDFSNIEECNFDDDGNKTAAEYCGTPGISYENKHILFSCETEGATYHYTISCEDNCAETETTEGSVELSATYNISVYATAAGYQQSETATAKLYFFASDEEGEVDGISVPAETIGVVVTTDGNSISVSGLEDGEQVEAYSLSGVKLGSSTSRYGSATISTGNATGVVILRMGSQAIKVKL
ncbi:MAG: leucine-rich repeat domain-containing protein, partial [Prevotellaceae bacterium]|nr:leucine-rich repeat domain-containing protein [Prevotellaceae bacterium]